MTNLQFISLLTPALGSVVLVVLAWLNQNQRLSDLRMDVNRGFDKVDAQFARVDAHLARIDDDLRQFYGTDKMLEGRINELSSRIK